jgi:serine/threonine-protein kinase
MAALASGTALGHYEIAGLLGAGGMGEVYRARDTRLRREVAIKVLPDAFARDEHRLSRFEREARLLAALNHPNVMTLHGLERSGEAVFLVMELVPGKTLAERLLEMPMSVREALGALRQVAEALEAAHEKGVVHRDLKPANLKITPEGRVKVLDFGLAKALEADRRDGVDSEWSTNAMTAVGVALGTAAYMSPEQARGRPVDRRADVWAFGCVLYEALTGHRAFPGETAPDALAAVLDREPDWQRLPPDTPPIISRLLRRCLRKDPAQRLRDIGDARLEIEEALTGDADPRPTGLTATALTPGPEAWGRRVLPWAIAILAIAAGATLAARGPRGSGRQARHVATRFSIVLPLEETLRSANSYVESPSLAVSPDGGRLVYMGLRGTVGRLYLRAMDRIEATGLGGTEGAPRGPFFSPDGQWVGFFDGIRMRKVPVTGGAAIDICNVPPVTRGASWGEDGVIVFAPSFSTGLWQVPSSGGTPQPLTQPDSAQGEIAHLWPQVLPGPKAVLFTVWPGGGFDEGHIAVLPAATGRPRRLGVRGAQARYAPSGHLLVARGGAILVAPFDLGRLEVTGEALPADETVLQSETTGAAHFDVSSTGTLAFMPSEAATGRRLVWVDRSGASRPTSGLRREFMSMRLSPDARAIAVEVGKDVWIYDLQRDALRRLTRLGVSNCPVWSPDGSALAFTAVRRSELPHLYRAPADGSRDAERLGTDDSVQIPFAWSRAGLAYGASPPVERGPEDWDVWLLPDPGNPVPRRVIREAFNQSQPEASPDGRWLAYVSDESGRFEVYVRPTGGGTGKWQVSADGGDEPRWSRSGGELFYREGDRVMTVEIERGRQLRASRPRALFRGPYLKSYGPDACPTYDVAPDGRFLMVEAGPETSGSRIDIMLHWLDQLSKP